MVAPLLMNAAAHVATSSRMVNTPPALLPRPGVAAVVVHPVIRASSPKPIAPQHHISRVDTTGLLSTEARLAALYRMNDPTKDAEVIAEKFRGNEAQLFSLLIQKYGEEAIDASDATALGELMDDV